MADLSVFATKENSDNGVWFPYSYKGRKLPLAILIYGSDCDSVKEFERQRIRKIGLKTNGNANISEDTIDELLDSSDEGVLVRIGGISTYDWKKKENTDEPIQWGDKVLKNDKKSYSILIENIPDVKDFVNEKSNERSNFLSNGKKN